MTGQNGQVLNKILDFLVCPICKEKFHYENMTLICKKETHHQYPQNVWGFFEFAQKQHIDKYDDEKLIMEYIGYAFGYKLISLCKSRFIGIGQSEGLYRSVSELVLEYVLKGKLYDKENTMILDVACGVGRNLADISKLLPNALFVGLDYAPQMIKYAREILISSDELTVNLKKSGFGEPTVKGMGLDNVFLAQADASELPFHQAIGQNGFDIVLNNMLIDRISNHLSINKSIHQSVSVIKEKGILIFTTPLNWINEESWNEHKSSRSSTLDLIEEEGISIIEAFDGLMYRELIDLHGTYLELPVLVAIGMKM